VASLLEEGEVGLAELRGRDHGELIGGKVAARDGRAVAPFSR